MSKIDVLNLVSKHSKDSVFAVHLQKQTLANKDLTARQSKRIHKIAVRDVMKGSTEDFVVRVPPSCPRLVAGSFDSLVLRGIRLGRTGLQVNVCGHLFPKLALILVRKLRLSCPEP